MSCSLGSKFLISLKISEEHDIQFFVRPVTMTSFLTLVRKRFCDKAPNCNNKSNQRLSNKRNCCSKRNQGCTQDSFTSLLASPVKQIVLGVGWGGLLSEANIRASVRLCQVSHQAGMQLEFTLQHPSQPAHSFHLPEVKILVSTSHLRRMRQTLRYPISKEQNRSRVCLQEAGHHRWTPVIRLGFKRAFRLD